MLSRTTVSVLVLRGETINQEGDIDRQFPLQQLQLKDSKPLSNKNKGLRNKRE